MRLRIPPRWDWLFLACAIAAAIALMLLLGCGQKRPPAPVLHVEAPAKLVHAPPVMSARDEVDDLTQRLQAAQQRLVNAEARERQAEQDAQRQIAQQQSRYATWIAGLIAGGSILYTVAAFAFGLPRQWGIYGFVGATALLVGARLWTWLADQALIAGLVLLALGIVAGLVLLVRHVLALKSACRLVDAVASAETNAEVAVAKAAEGAKQIAQGVHGLIARARRG